MQKIIFLLTLFAWHFAMAGDYNYTLSWSNPVSHQYNIKLTTETASGNETVFQIPAWRPGRYIEQRYAAAVSDFSAKDEKGKVLQFQKSDRDSWTVTNPSSGKISIEYKFYAAEIDAGSSYLSKSMAYFNPVNIFMHVKDRYDLPCTLTVSSMPQEWKSATAMKKDAYNVFSTNDWHELADSPTILSPDIKELMTEVDGAKFYVDFQGNFLGTKAVEDTLLKNLSKIIAEQKKIFGEMPLGEYHFIVLLLPYNYRHAVEHQYSSCFTLPETVTKDASTIAGMYGIMAHEFFHLWNVKRIRPAGLWPYDYQHIQYTTLHWFTEGVTDYYTDLTLVRAGVTTRQTYLMNWANSIGSLENSYAAHNVSPSSSSFDSWLSGSEFADPHLQTSYYPLGERVGLLLDLQIRSLSSDRACLDHVMKYLYNEYYKKGKGVPEDGIEKAILAATGYDLKKIFESFINGTSDINYETLFKGTGIEIKMMDDQNALWQKIGIDKVDRLQSGIITTIVRPGGDAFNAGLGDGDLIVEINGKAISKIDEKALFSDLRKGDAITLKVYSMGKTSEVKVQCTGKNFPFIFMLAFKAKMKEEEQAKLDKWLE